MKNYNWNYPTTMWVGENRIKNLSNACNQLNIKKPLLVTDSGLAQSDIVKNSVPLYSILYSLRFHIFLQDLSKTLAKIKFFLLDI